MTIKNKIIIAAIIAILFDIFVAYQVISSENDIKKQHATNNTAAEQFSNSFKNVK